MPRPTRAARLTRSADRLRRIAAKVRPAGAPVPEHEHRRRLLSGGTVPATVERRSWLDHIGPGPRVTGQASLNSDHPSHLHRPMLTFPTPVDLTTPPDWSQELYRAVPKASGLPRRRRRQLARDLRGAGEHVQVAAPDAWQPRTLTTEAKPVDRATRRAKARAVARDIAKRRRADNPVPKAINNASASRAVIRWVERQAPDSEPTAEVKAAHNLALGALHSAAAERQAARLSRRSA